MTTTRLSLVIYGASALIAASLIWSISQWFVNQGSAANADEYQRALAAQNPDNICQTPPGYTDEEWLEHMGHHPDQYQECL